MGTAILKFLHEIPPPNLELCVVHSGSCIASQSTCFSMAAFCYQVNGCHFFYFVQSTWTLETQLSSVPIYYQHDFPEKSLNFSKSHFAHL